MKTPALISPSEIKKLCDAADQSYKLETPRKIRALRNMEIPSRITKPMSKSDLAKITEIMPQNIGKMEKDYGEPHGLNPSLSFIQKVAIIFNIDANFLLGLRDEPAPLYNDQADKTTSAIETSGDKMDQLIELNKKILKALTEPDHVG